MAGVDWDKVYKREYIPPPIIQKSNYLNFFEQPKIFVDNNCISREKGKNEKNLNQIHPNDKGDNIYEGWSFVQGPPIEGENILKNSKHMKSSNKNQKE